MDETEFQCRSANFDPSTGDCAMSDKDRYSDVRDRHFVPAANTTEYLESNCVDDGGAQGSSCCFLRFLARVLLVVELFLLEKHNSLLFASFHGRATAVALEDRPRTRDKSRRRTG
ncbi:hypothetical protein MTO96_030673 [Rhipicephalus appendiculatus]